MVKNLPVLTGDTRDVVSVFGWERSPGGRAWQLSLVLLPGECHGQTSLAGYNPWGRKELDMTEHTSVDTDSVKNFFFILCIYLFMFGCAESSLLCGIFSSCGKQGLLSGCCECASHCSAFFCCGAHAQRACRL